MKRDDLLDAVGGIDSEIIEESRKLRQNKKPYRNRLAVILPIAAAALLAVGVISAVLWNSMHGNTGAEVTDPGNPVETVTLYENSHEMNEEERAALEAAEKAAETAEQAYQAYLAELKRQREEAAAAFAAAEAEEEAARQASEAEKQALEAARQAEKEASKRAEETAEEIHLTKISFDDTSDVILGIGQSIKARVTVTLKKELVYSRDDIRFISENPEIAVVSQVNSLYGEYYFYTIKALKEGETYVYASSKDGSITSEKVKVIVSPPVERIELSVTSDDLALGEKIRITVEYFPENASGKEVVWNCNNSKTAHVDWNGNVYAAGGGSAVVTASTPNGKSSSAKITVDGAKKLMQLNVTYEGEEGNGTDAEPVIEPLVNGEPAAQEYVISAGDTLSFRVKLPNSADNSETGKAAAFYTVTEDDFDKGFTVKLDVDVPESGTGGQSIRHTVTYDFFFPTEKVYVWEKEGFGPKGTEGTNDFYIRLKPDGTFEYYVGAGSGHIGEGYWSKDGDILTLDESRYSFDEVFYFSDRGDRLVFVSDGSSGFFNVKVEDGDAFLYREDYEPFEGYRTP